MADVLEMIVRARDEASKVLQGVGESGAKAGAAIDKHWKQAAVAMAAASAAIEAQARKQRDMTMGVQRLSAATGIETGEIRKLAGELSNATFPLESVINLMEQGRAQGLRSAEELGQYAAFWDMVGDASGETADDLARASVGLRSVGVEVGHDNEALGALGYVLRETSGGIGEFLKFLDKAGPDLREMNLEVDDAAAMLGALEHELGMSSRTARMEFTTAVALSQGSLEALMNELGLAPDVLDEYKTKVQDSSGVVGEQADIFMANRTALEHLMAGVKDFMFQHGELIFAVSQFVPLMMMAVPAVKGLRVAMLQAGGAMATLRAGMIKFMSLALNPYVLAIGAAVAVFMIWNNQKKEAAARAKEIAETLDVETAALTANTTATIKNMLAASGALGVLNTMEVTVSEFTRRIEDGARGTDLFTEAEIEMAAAAGHSGAEIIDLAQEVILLGEAIDDGTKLKLEDIEAIRLEEEANRDLSVTLHDHQAHQQVASDRTRDARDAALEHAEALEDEEGALDASLIPLERRATKLGTVAELLRLAIERDKKWTSVLAEQAAPVLAAIKANETYAETLARIDEDGKRTTEELQELQEVTLDTQEAFDAVTPEHMEAYLLSLQQIFEWSREEAELFVGTLLELDGLRIQPIFEWETPETPMIPGWGGALPVPADDRPAEDGSTTIVLEVDGAVLARTVLDNDRRR